MLNLTDFLEKLATDDALKEKAAQYFTDHKENTLEEVLAFLNENSCNTTIEELKKYQEEKAQAIDTVEIKSSKYGHDCGCVLGGGGTGDWNDENLNPRGINKTCACVLGGGGETTAKIIGRFDNKNHCRCWCVGAGTGYVYTPDKAIK